MSPTVSVAVDGSPASSDALSWAARESARRRLPLRILHAWLPILPMRHDQCLEAARKLLTEAVDHARVVAPDIEITAVAREDMTAAALAAESRHAALLVVGSRGRGGFRGLLLGSNSLVAAALAECPVVVARGVGGASAESPSTSEVPGIPDVPQAPGVGSVEVGSSEVGTSDVRSASDPSAGEEGAGGREIVVAIDAREADSAVLGFAFEAAALRPGVRVRVVHAWSMTSSILQGGPVFDEQAVAAATERLVAEVTAGWARQYPQVEIVRESVHANAAKVLVAASAHAELIVLGRRIAGSSLGLRLGRVAHATLVHAQGPVAVVPY